MINYLFGDKVQFSGPYHGLVAFIVVVTAMLAVEQVALRIYRALD